MKKKNINLLQERGAPPTLWEKIYDWMTNTCRIIVIFTELLVLGAFGWRFWLDRELNDLKDAIEDQGEVLKNLADDEAEIRVLQDKLLAYGQLWDSSSNYSLVFNEINRYVPTNTEDLTVALRYDKDGRSFTIEGQVEREEIDELENDLKDSSVNFSDVVLASIDDKGDNLWDFTIRGKIILSELRTSLSINQDADTELTTPGAL